MVPALLLLTSAVAIGGYFAYDGYQNRGYRSHPCTELRNLYKEAKDLGVRDTPIIKQGFRLAEQNCKAGAEYLTQSLAQEREQQEQFRRDLIKLLDELIKSSEGLFPQTPTQIPTK